MPMLVHYLLNHAMRQSTPAGAVMVDGDYGRYCEHVPYGANVHAQFRHVDAYSAADHPV